MLKKTITYTDFDGKERTEDHYFNLTKAEIMDMELSIPGGMTSLIEKISQTEDTPALIELFKKILERSYGKKSADGRRFIKSKEIFDEFASTEAYSEMFMELCTDADAAAAFVAGVLPKVPNKNVAPMKN